MAKKKNAKKIEKETRKVIEAISDLVRRKNDTYKFKGKKKQIKEVRKTCVHWIIRKGITSPTIMTLDTSPDKWTCKVCKKSFPKAIKEISEYQAIINAFEEIVNQCFFYSVNMGGNSDATKVFLTLKRLLPKYQRITTNLMKRIKKRDTYENRRMNSDIVNQFGNYSAITYK